MSKFTYTERNLIKNIVATLTIKRIPDNEIIKAIFEQTNKSMTVRNLTLIKKQIKKDSYQWYTKLRQDQYAYIHEYKERIEELLSLQQMHHEIIENNKHNPQIQQTSLAELHRISITLSNFYDVASDIVSHATIPTTPTEEVKAATTRELITV